MMFKKIEPKGFTLVEVVVVSAIITVLSMMIVPVCAEYVSKSRAKVCEINCEQCESMYHMYLQLEKREHSDVNFNKFVLEYGEGACPSKGCITYVDGEVICGIHASVEEKEEDDVPIL